MKSISTDVLVVGGGTGGTVAAIQASRRGAKTILVSECNWLGGMLTAAGVCAPDGNELVAWQTGIWGKYIQELNKRQPKGLDNGWVSLFTYDPRIGAGIFADWVNKIPNLKWIWGNKPLEVVRENKRIIAVKFDNFLIAAKIIIDATELGDLLALAEIPYRWGWELQAEFNEPSAPVEHNRLTEKYPVQAPTWVFMMQDYGDIEQEGDPVLSFPSKSFQNAWDDYGLEKFLNYGRLTKDLYMINWPICGNDYGEQLNHLIGSETERQQFLAAAYHHSYNFATFIQSQTKNRYRLAQDIFPHTSGKNSGSTNLQLKIDPAFAFYPYYRESRRLGGQTTVTENHILPLPGGSVAPLPINQRGEVSAIAIGNYANDHHYPGFDFPLQPKSILWGGRWTGTPFTIPYDALVPESIEGLLVCEKNISVSHIANGSTRLQPVVMNIGQAAGMAAALCVELNCQPQALSVNQIQEALLTDKYAPAGVIPLYNLSPSHPDWLYWQRYYLANPEAYPSDGNCPCTSHIDPIISEVNSYRGRFMTVGNGEYGIAVTSPESDRDRVWQLITLRPEVNLTLLNYNDGQLISVSGRYNSAGNWLVVEEIAKIPGVAE